MNAFRPVIDKTRCSENHPALPRHVFSSIITLLLQPALSGSWRIDNALQNLPNPFCSPLLGHGSSTWRLLQFDPPAQFHACSSRLATRDGRRQSMVQCQKRRIRGVLPVLPQRYGPQRPTPSATKPYPFMLSQTLKPPASFLSNTQHRFHRAEVAHRRWVSMTRQGPVPRYAYVRRSPSRVPPLLLTLLHVAFHGAKELAFRLLEYTKDIFVHSCMLTHGFLLHSVSLNSTPARYKKPCPLYPRGTSSKGPLRLPRDSPIQASRAFGHQKKMAQSTEKECIQILTYIRRKPTLTQAQFYQHWEHVHAAKVTHFPSNATECMPLNNFKVIPWAEKHDIRRYQQVRSFAFPQSMRTIHCCVYCA